MYNTRSKSGRSVVRRHVNRTVNGPFFKELRVNLKMWSDDVINKMKLGEKFYILENQNEFQPVEKKQKFDKRRKDILKLVITKDNKTDMFKSRFKTADDDDDDDDNMKNLKNVNNSSIDPLKIVCDNPLEDKELDSFSKIGRIRCCNIYKLLDASRVENYHKLFETPLELLYHKYITKFVQNKIVIIANILKIVLMSQNHHKSRKDKAAEIKSEAEKLQECRNAYIMHELHKTVLQSKLQKCFTDVISIFPHTEFKRLFQMFILSLFQVILVYDRPDLDNDNILKYVIELLRSSTHDNDLYKVFEMIGTERFPPESINLTSLIEGIQNCDPVIANRMSLFFVLSLKSREYFQEVIKVVTGDSNENLALLIDIAAFKCSVNLKFKDFLDSPSTSTVNDNITVINNTPETPVQHTPKSNDLSQAKRSDGLVQGQKNENVSHCRVSSTLNNDN